jgi:hypothetical protein
VKRCQAEGEKTKGEKSRDQVNLSIILCPLSCLARYTDSELAAVLRTPAIATVQWTIVEVTAVQTAEKAVAIAAATTTPLALPTVAQQYSSNSRENNRSRRADATATTVIVISIAAKPAVESSAASKATAITSAEQQQQHGKHQADQQQ